MAGQGVQVLWFKRDLRLADHAALHAASAAAHVQNTTLLCLYIIEPSLWQQPDMAGRHWAFIAECLTALAEQLQALGHPLVVMEGEAVEILQTLHQTHGIRGLFSHLETGNLHTFARDKAVAAWARQHGVPWHQAQPFGVWRGSTKIKNRPDWAKQWEAFVRTPLLPTPTTLPPPPPGLISQAIPTTLPWLAADDCPHRQRGGWQRGLAVLNSFFTGRGAAYHRQLSSPLTARQACSRWSPHLAYGTLSLREVVQRAYTEAAAPHISESQRRALRALISRLHWHCHFIQKLEDEPAMEHTALHPALRNLRPTAMDAATQARFTAWAEGRTGWPLVDATMLELKATGWITFRMRALLVSVATVHLWLPWQAVALHLARLFTDYEPGIHYPQVQMQSGATGMNTVRAYNPTKQATDHDPEGHFIRRWLPALANVPAPFIHTPWLMDSAQQQAYGCILGTDYPHPLVDEAAARKQGIEQLYLPRKAEAFKAVQKNLVQKHSQRGGPNPNRPPRATTTPKPKAAPQTLPLFENL